MTHHKEILCWTTRSYNWLLKQVGFASLINVGWFDDERPFPAKSSQSANVDTAVLSPMSPETQTICKFGMVWWWTAVSRKILSISQCVPGRSPPPMVHETMGVILEYGLVTWWEAQIVWTVMLFYQMYILYRNANGRRNVPAINLINPDYFFVRKW